MIYQWTASSLLPYTQSLGYQLLLNLYQKLRCGMFGDTDPPIPELTSGTRIDSAYCLDAPDHIPAGGCTYWSDPEDAEFSNIPEQLTVTRGE